MSCQYRNCLAAGTYYALRRTEPPHLIFAEPRDYEEFDTFLAQALGRVRTKQLGYCWMPDTIHLALRVDVTPLAEVMQGVTRYCSQRIRRRTGADASTCTALP